MGDGVSVIVVPEASSRGGQNFIMVKEDHNSICKPRDKESANYLHLTKLINEISTSTVLKTVCKQRIPDDLQTLPQKFVKPSKCLEDIKEELKKHSCLALWGMGGIGKTTISKVFFNDLHYDFKFTLFTENVKLLQGEGRELERMLLADVHHNGRKPGGLALNDLKDEAILVVLDDVEKDCHTAFIYTLQQICSSKSRFILTARDKHILTQLHDVSIVAVEVLDSQNSEKLFQSYAFFDKVDMLQWQQEFQNEIVRGCKGLPLTLEVVGRYLKDCGSQEVWEQTCKQLMKIDSDSALIGQLRKYFFNYSVRIQSS
ncbi:hypothetical protein Mapa_003441 [Marchantia paleacea]|nr:hypothetical protein Mapa_003441 [Marchantia paleacea]